MICVNIDSSNFYSNRKRKNPAFTGVWFQKRAIYRKYKTNLLRALEGLVSRPNLAQFGPRSPENYITKLLPKMSRGKFVQSSINSAAD